MKNKSFLIFAGLIVLIGVLLYASRYMSTAVAVYWPNTEVQCLQYGHQNITLHIHPLLKIVVDGEVEGIPANIGVVPNCMAEVHTHDASGELHLESATQDRTFTLADFFAVWGVPVARDGFTHSVTINGEEVSDIGARTLNDRDEIVITYTSAGGTPIPLSVPLP